jgi:hypothetical protein
MPRLEALDARSLPFRAGLRADAFDASPDTPTLAFAIVRLADGFLYTAEHPALLFMLVDIGADARCSVAAPAPRDGPIAGGRPR